MYKLKDTFVLILLIFAVFIFTYTILNKLFAFFKYIYYNSNYSYLTPFICTINHIHWPHCNWE